VNISLIDNTANTVRYVSYILFYPNFLNVNKHSCI